MISTYFLGACGPQGFHSHYDSLLQELENLTVIKGGSGCGKSTFMKKIGAAAEASGLDVSYILCSSDPDSLDAVLLPSLSLGFVDGTAPHVLEPALCGGRMNYLNFGEFYDRQTMLAGETAIRRAQKENAAQYPHVTACLAAADRLLDCVRISTQAQEYDEEMDAIAQCLILSTLIPTGKTPILRHRFLSAVTPKGISFCQETPTATCSKVYVLEDTYLLAPRLLQHLLDKATAYGHECIICHHPLMPEGQPAHLIIPTAGTAFVASSRLCPYSGKSFCRIDLDSTVPPQKKAGLTFCLDTVEKLLHQAALHMKEAKRIHDCIEQLCRPYVDFSAVDRLTEKTIRDLFNA